MAADRIYQSVEYETDRMGKQIGDEFISYEGPSFQKAVDDAEWLKHCLELRKQWNHAVEVREVLGNGEAEVIETIW